MSKTEMEQRAHDAAIDHGMWLAPDDDETNYEAFVAGYLRGYSDRGVEATNARDEYLAAATLRDKEIEALLAKVAELEADASAVAIQEKRMYLSLPETK